MWGREFGLQSGIHFSPDLAGGGGALEAEDRWAYVEKFGGLEIAKRALSAGTIAVMNTVGMDAASGEVELRTKGVQLLYSLTRVGMGGCCMFWDSSDTAERQIHRQVRADIARARIDALQETAKIAWGKIFAVFVPGRERLPAPRASFSLAQWSGVSKCNHLRDGVVWYSEGEEVFIPRVGAALASDNNILVARAPTGFVVSPEGKLLGKRAGIRVLQSANKPKAGGVDIVREAVKVAALLQDPDNVLFTSSSVAIWLSDKDGIQPKVTVTTFLPIGIVDWEGVITKFRELSPEEVTIIRNVPGGLAFNDVLRDFAISMLQHPGHLRTFEDTVFCFRTHWIPALSIALRDERAEAALRASHNVAVRRRPGEVQVYLQARELSTHWR